jgi:hypothetical protein
VALGILVILLLAFIESVWLGFALLSLIAAGTLVASAIAITNTVAER